MISPSLHDQIDGKLLSTFTEQVDITKTDSTVNDYGEREETTVTVHEGLDAWVDQEGAREAIRASRIQDQTAFIVRIPYQEGITNDMRVQWKSHTLAIQGLPHDLQNTGSILELLCLIVD